MDEGSSSGWCSTTSLDKCAGQLWDAEGKVVADGSGHVKIPDLSEETYDDLEMTVVLDDEKKNKMPLKEAMRTTGAKRIREACIAFVKELKDSINTGAASANAAKSKPAPSSRSNSTYVTSAAESSKTSTIKINYTYTPPPSVMYDTFLDTNRIRGATASDASISGEVGGKISLFSGSVEGENVALTPFDGEKAVIVWKWRFSTWQPGHFSKVTLTFEAKDDGTTELRLVQTGVPEEEAARTEQGWKGLLLDRLKAMLGGSVLG